MTGREHESLRATAARLRDRFTELAAERDKPGRDDFTPDGRTFRWQEYELFGMLTAVNDERAGLGKPPVAMAEQLIGWLLAGAAMAWWIGRQERQAAR